MTMKKEKAIENMTLPELLAECKKRNLAMNDLTKTSEDGRVWVNPNHQDCFNF